MKVYLVWEHEPWESDYLVGVYLKEEDACGIANMRNASEYDHDCRFDVEVREVE